MRFVILASGAGVNIAKLSSLYSRNSHLAFRLNNGKASRHEVLLLLAGLDVDCDNA